MRSESVDLLVIGAGPAGLGAATVAAGEGLRVLVVDEAPRSGGRLPLQLHQDAAGRWTPGQAEARRLTDAAMAAGARIVTGACAWGLFPGWEAYLAAIDPAEDAHVPDRVRATAVVVATGAVQRPVALPGWTLPGVLCAGAAQALLHVHRIRPGGRAVVVGVDALGLGVAAHLRMGGVEVLGILPAAPGLFGAEPEPPGAIMARVAALAERAPQPSVRLAGQLVRAIPAAARAAEVVLRTGVMFEGIPLLLGRAVTAIVGTEAVAAVRIADLARDGRMLVGTEEEWPVDTVVTSAGLAPLVELLDVAGVPLVHVPELGGHVPLHGPDLQTPVPGIHVAGSATGVAAWPVAVAQGELAGAVVAQAQGRPGAERRLAAARQVLAEGRRRTPPILADEARGLARLAELWTGR